MLLKLLAASVVLLVGCSETPNIGQSEQERGQANSEVEASHKSLSSHGIPLDDIGQKYLIRNAKRPGVTVLPSGLQFEVIDSGEGRSPLVTSNVVTHYHGSFVNGDVFDSSIERGEPAEFPVNRVIPGWTEALQLMKEGDKWRLVLPPDIAYGEKGAAGGLIPPNSVLVFEVELIEVKG
jgi:FKBP-type peptidyl-prolyl cis-trans isomerase FklB